jgi:biopolymer transport protein ExbD
MGEINTAAGGSRHGGAVHKSKKLSTRVDLTPMVDLGFLLITFFMVSMTWSKPKVMQFYSPADGPPTNYPESATLTVVACDRDRVFYYHGRLEDALQNGNYGFTSYHVVGGIGNTIRQKQQQMEHSRKGFSKEMTLIIHPVAESNYQNIVNLLDEVVINDIRHHVLNDLSEYDRNILVNHKIDL